MVLNVILNVTPQRSKDDGFELLAQRCAMDFTDVLEHALLNWHLFADRDTEELRASLEAPLVEQMYYRRRRRLDRMPYSEFVELVEAFLRSTSAIYACMEDIITPLASKRFANADVCFRLIGFTHSAAIIEISPRGI